MIDAILLLVAVEVLVFWLLPRFRLRAPRLHVAHCAYLWPTLLSGALLMLAVRLALTDADWRVLGGVLASAGLAHAVDIGLRVRLSASD